MLIFHEGLPGSGKSFEAMVSHIVPALQKGRQVFAYIEGLDHDRIALCAGIPVDRCRQLLHQVLREDVQRIYEVVQNDSLVVIDELQNFFPAGRQKLSPEITQFVTEHRHRGLDVLCMGQVLNDCHALWKGRIDTKFEFIKLDAIGKPTHYKWVSYKRVSGGKFQKVSEDKRAYDPQYFGTYASHTDDTSNTGTYSDDRTNVKNTKAFKTIKIYAGVAIFAVAFVIWFFVSGGGGMGKKKPDETKAQKPPEVVQVQTVQQVQPVAPARITVTQVIAEVETEANDYIDKLSEKHRMRLAGFSLSSRQIRASIEWRDESNRVVDVLTADQLRGLGWFVMLSADGGIASVSKPGKTYIATQWPLGDDRSSSPERVPQKKQAEISVGGPSSQPPSSSPSQVATGQG